MQVVLVPGGTACGGNSSSACASTSASTSTSAGASACASASASASASAGAGASTAHGNQIARVQPLQTTCTGIGTGAVTGAVITM
jgi:hypothetical protein